MLKFFASGILSANNYGSDVISVDLDQISPIRNVDPGEDVSSLTEKDESQKYESVPNCISTSPIRSNPDCSPSIRPMISDVTNDGSKKGHILIGGNNGSLEEITLENIRPTIADSSNLAFSPSMYDFDAGSSFESDAPKWIASKDNGPLNPTSTIITLPENSSKILY